MLIKTNDIVQSSFYHFMLISTLNNIYIFKDHEHIYF